MRKIYTWGLPFILLGLMSCMKSVSLSTLRPAEINVPNHIQSIVLVDRTEFDKDAIGVIEGILTGEGLNEDKDAILAVFSALQNNLRNSPRYEVKLASEKLKGNTITGALPDPLTWSQINSLTRRYNADALLALEVFDSDFIVTKGARKNTRKVKNEDGKEVEEEYTEFYAEGVGNVRIGLRMYDPKDRAIIDQEVFTQNRTWEKTAANVKEAVASLIEKSQATKYLGGNVGSIYAGKIAPLPVRISREYYAKPKKNFHLSKGARQAQVGQWDDAISTWKAGLTSNGSTKAKGRMAYNIALGYEVIGDLPMAHRWAGNAFVNYGEKKGQQYAAQLNSRMRSEDIVNQQMALPEEAQESSSGEVKPTMNVKVKKKN
jgi:hypothetical protein